MKAVDTMLLSWKASSFQSKQVFIVSFIILNDYE